MPKGVSERYTGAKRSAAARKGARNRKRGAAQRARLAAVMAGGDKLMTRAEIARHQGSERHRVLDGPSVSTLIARIRARAETDGDA